MEKIELIVEEKLFNKLQEIADAMNEKNKLRQSPFEIQPSSVVMTILFVNIDEFAERHLPKDKND